MPIYKNKNGDGYIVKVNYTNAKGEYKQVYRCNSHTLTKNDAKKYEVQILEEIKKGMTTDNNILFSELFHFFISQKKNELRASTIRNYEKVYRLYLDPYFANKKIYDINKRDVINWKDEMCKLNDNISTLRGFYRNFNVIFSYGVKFYNIPENVVSNVGNFKKSNSIGNDKIMYWTLDQFHVFQNALEMECRFKGNDSQLRWWATYCAFNILFFCGLRKGEALALKWSDLVCINGTYYLSVTKSINQKVTPPEITPPKNKTSIRKVPVCDELLTILLEQRDRCKNIVSFNDSLFYICGTLRPISDTALTEVKNEFAVRCDLPKIRIHDFRHSYCSLLLNADANIPLSVIASLLGHSNTDVTQRVYSHIYPDSQTRVLEYLNKLK